MKKIFFCAIFVAVLFGRDICGDVGMQGVLFNLKTSPAKPSSDVSLKEVTCKNSVVTQRYILKNFENFDFDKLAGKQKQELKEVIKNGTIEFYCKKMMTPHDIDVLNAIGLGAFDMRWAYETQTDKIFEEVLTRYEADCKR
ncbi:hypothetical protein [Campylobacter curvus]|uniref:hypothetical protein n=1 Tax=Campylobacter curvus TaxID=200 RepID=UPI00147083B4|nr:hypothetical protein [Campylobacter curvus]